jgi:hypothetical protein
VPWSSKWVLSFTSSFQNFVCIPRDLPPCVQHILPVSPSLIYFVSMKIYAAHNVIFSSLPPLPLPYVQIYTLLSCSWTLLVYVLTLVWQTKFDAYIKRVKLYTFVQGKVRRWSQF